MSPGTLFERVGGEDGVLALTAALHERCLADPVLNHPFSHPTVSPDHVERLAAYLTEVMGGPARYAELGADHSSMLALHAGNGDVTELGERFVACFVAAADDAGLPGDYALRAALAAAIAQAVAEVVSYPGPPETVPSGLATPRWGPDGRVERA